MHTRTTQAWSNCIFVGLAVLLIGYALISIGGTELAQGLYWSAIYNMGALGMSERTGTMVLIGAGILTLLGVTTAIERGWGGVLAFGVGALLLGAAILFGVVRFIHWAWVTT